MLVSKNSDIDLTKSETKTLFGFIFLYSILILVIVGIVSILYYNFQKDLLLQEKRILLQKYSNELVLKLKDLHIKFPKNKEYPRDEKYNSAIFDSDKKLIFSTLESKKVNFDDIAYLSSNKIHFIKQPESYYLGAKYVVIEIPDDNFWYKKVKNEILSIGLFGFILFTLIGYFMVKLLLKPMRDSLHLLDRFIKDTTHELNTPISAIITNIEMIDKTKLDEKLTKKINRIDIGAKTISNIYEDLTFLTLNNKIISQNKKVNISKVLRQRCEYFRSLANVKKINFILSIKEDVFLLIDEKKISKLIDNLLSNAIKYNKVSGTIKIVLDKNYFFIEDTGIGMTRENLSTIFERYSRFDKSVGGFGIGLNIVFLISKEYKLKLDVKSQLNHGTKIEVKWQD